MRNHCFEKKVRTIKKIKKTRVGSVKKQRILKKEKKKKKMRQRSMIKNCFEER